MADVRNKVLPARIPFLLHDRDERAIEFGHESLLLLGVGLHLGLLENELDDTGSNTRLLVVREDLPACLHKVKINVTYIDGLIENLQGEESAVRVLTIHENGVDASPRVRVCLELVENIMCFVHLQSVSDNQVTYHILIVCEHEVYDGVERLQPLLVEGATEVHQDLHVDLGLGCWRVSDRKLLVISHDNKIQVERFVKNGAFKFIN